MRKKDTDYQVNEKWGLIDEFILILKRITRRIVFGRGNKTVKFEGDVKECSGFKVANIKEIAPLHFKGVSFGSYGGNDRFRCINSGWHYTPAYWCSCGFHSFKKIEDALKLFMRVKSSEKVLLEVEMYGDIVEHEDGYRSEYQEVVGIVLSAKCLVKDCNYKTYGLSKVKKRFKTSCYLHFSKGVSISELTHISKLNIRLANI